MRVALGESAVIIFGDTGTNIAVPIALSPPNLFDVPPELEEGPLVPPGTDIGGGPTPQLPTPDEVKRLANFRKQIATHTWNKPGTYKVWVQARGSYKWNGDDGSCSYSCENVPISTAPQRYLCPDSSNYMLTVVVEENPTTTP
jgi:hypothetical protein